MDQWQQQGQWISGSGLVDGSGNGSDSGSMAVGQLTAAALNFSKSDVHDRLEDEEKARVQKKQHTFVVV